MPSATDKFLRLLADAVRDRALVKLTLGAHRGGDVSLHKVIVRPVILRAGPRLSFVYRHATRDVTKNFPPAAAQTTIAAMLGQEFFSAHLATTAQTAQWEVQEGAAPRLTIGKVANLKATTTHDREKQRSVCADSPWLCALGVTNGEGKVRADMTAKFRQIHRFVEVLAPLFGHLPKRADQPVRLVDMGCGKGYLTFAVHEHLRASGRTVETIGLEAWPELADLCNTVAQENHCDGLRFEAGTIESAKLESVDVLIALHACDTATDDAIARGLAADAALIVVAPCCQKELRRQLRAPPVLAGTLRHGIFQERQSEFVTDALRAGLLEWAGYDTKVFEFISLEHTNKNLMITATRSAKPGRDEPAGMRVRELAEFFGIKRHRLAAHLHFNLTRA